MIVKYVLNVKQIIVLDLTYDMTNMQIIVVGIVRNILQSKFKKGLRQRSRSMVKTTLLTTEKHIRHVLRNMGHIILKTILRKSKQQRRRNMAMKTT